MNKAKWMVWGAFLVALCGIGWLGSAGAGDEESNEVQLFYGVTYLDTLAHRSKWFDVRGANRIMLRTYSMRSTAATDSIYSDSIGVLRVFLSDSLSFMARDSAGTIVTASSNIPTTSAHGPTYPVCADSVVINALPDAVTPDTTYKMVSVAFPPIRVALRTPVSGSGAYTLIIPALPPAGTSIYGDGSIGAKYCAIEFTPVTRVTGSGANSTTPNRTQGIKGLTMSAIRIYKNR